MSVASSSIAFWDIKETLIKSKFVIFAKAGIQKNQRNGFRLAPE
jgi:hypothetical protein